jgi:hypothetical protein
LFAPYAVRFHESEYSDMADISSCLSGNADIWESLHGAVYEEQPSEAHLRIPEHAFTE